MPSNWNLDDGLKLVRALQMETRKYGYHLTLGGGVLNNGESKKDIDLYFLPLDNTKLAQPNPGSLIDWLVKMWGNYEIIGDNYGMEPDQPTLNTLTGDSLTSEAERLRPMSWQVEPVVLPTPKPNSAYKYMLKFTRNSGDRIDAFIL